MDQRKLMDNANTITDMAKVSNSGLNATYYNFFNFFNNELKTNILFICGLTNQW